MHAGAAGRERGDERAGLAVAAQRPELDLVIGFQGLGGGACPAASTSDQAHLDGVAAADLGTADVREACDRGGGRGGLYEVASGGVGGLAHEVVTVPMGGYGRVSALPFKVLDRFELGGGPEGGNPSFQGHNEGKREQIS